MKEGESGDDLDCDGTTHDERQRAPPARYWGKGVIFSDFLENHDFFGVLFHPFRTIQKIDRQQQSSTSAATIS